MRGRRRRAAIVALSALAAGARDEASERADRIAFCGGLAGGTGRWSADEARDYLEAPGFL